MVRLKQPKAQRRARHASVGETLRPTLRTIAEASGLAVTTISRALANDPKIALATRNEVAELARKLGYVPDRAAQRLRTGRTKVIGLILDPHREIIGFGNSLIFGLARALAGSGYHLTITPQFLGEDPLEPIRHIVRNRLADAVVFARTTPQDLRIKYLLEHNLPFVCHGRSELATPHCFVDFDNEAFAYAAACRLARAGVKRFSLISPPAEFTFANHLRMGCVRAAMDFGLSFSMAEGVSLASSPAELSAWARSVENPPEGIIFPGEASFIAVAAGFRARGLVRGRDYHVVVKASTDLLTQIDPDIDCIIEDIEEVGGLIGGLLIDVLTGRIAGPKGVIQQPRGMLRGKD